HSAPPYLHSFPTRRSSDLGNVLLTGQMGSPLNFGEGALSGVNGAVNIYVAGFASDGSPKWSKSMAVGGGNVRAAAANASGHWFLDRKSTRLNSSHVAISYA